MGATVVSSVMRRAAWAMMRCASPSRQRHEVALDQLHAVAPVENVVLVLLQLLQAQLRIGAAGIERLQLLRGALGGGGVIGVDGVGGIELDVLDAAERAPAPRPRAR